MSAVYSEKGEEVFPAMAACRNEQKSECRPDSPDQRQYRDNGIARVLKFSDLIPPEKVASLIGANHSRPAGNDTRLFLPVLSASVEAAKACTYTFHRSWLRERLQIIHRNMVLKRALRPKFSITIPSRVKELLSFFPEYHPRYTLPSGNTLPCTSFLEELKRRIETLARTLCYPGSRHTKPA